MFNIDLEIGFKQESQRLRRDKKVMLLWSRKNMPEKTLNQASSRENSWHGNEILVNEKWVMFVVEIESSINIAF